MVVHVDMYMTRCELSPAPNCTIALSVWGEEAESTFICLSAHLSSSAMSACLKLFVLQAELVLFILLRLPQNRPCDV